MAATSLESWDIAELLARLSDKSLVSWDPATGRYGMLQTVRQFLGDQVLAQEESATLRERHLRHYLEFTRDAENRLRGPDQVEWIRRFDEEVDNFRAAIEWGLGSPELWAATSDLVVDVFDYWTIRSAYIEGIAVMEQLVERAPEDEPMRRLRLLVLLAAFYGFTGDPRAESACEDALRSSQSLGPEAIAMGCFSHGFAMVAAGRLQEAEPSLARALEAFREQGDVHMFGFTLMLLGNAAQCGGDLDRSESLYRECLELRERLGDTRGCGATLGGLAQIAEQRGDFETAARLDRQSVEAKLEVMDHTGLAGALCGCCVIPWIQGDYPLAAQLLGASDALCDRYGARRDIADEASHQRWMNRLREKLGDDYEAHWQAGRRLSLDEVVAIVRG